MFRVNGNSYSTSDFIPFLSGRTKVQLSRQVISCIKSNRKCLEESLANGDTIYGVNTGFGALSQVKISENDQKLLQLNLVRSHSAGTGTPFSPEVVRLTMVLKLLDISFGYSGVRRSEEHTSELQSRTNLVCRLLLEKKNKKNNKKTNKKNNNKKK